MPFLKTNPSYTGTALVTPPPESSTSAVALPTENLERDVNMFNVYRGSK